MSAQIALRIENELLIELDALIPLLNTPWRRMTRSDVLRAVVLMGLPALKAQAKAMVDAMAEAKSVGPVPTQPTRQTEHEAKTVTPMPIPAERSGSPPKARPVPGTTGAAPIFDHLRRASHQVASPQVVDCTQARSEAAPTARPVAASATHVRLRLDQAVRSGTIKLSLLADEIGVWRSDLLDFRRGTTMAQEKLRALDAALRRHGV